MISRFAQRKLMNSIYMVMAAIATAFGVFWLVWILWTTLHYGMNALHLQLFRQDTPPPGAEGGGLRNAFVGSLIVLLIAIVVGTPLGVLAGTWLAEFGARRRLGSIIRFLNDILLSTPSIIIGLFVYAVVVKPTGHFSAYSGGIALALILIPVVVRTTDEMLRLVPNSLREAAVALGTPYWKLVTQLTWRAASSGILTGLLLGLARISGETAPLLFTALNNQFWSTNLSHPIANLPMVIFQFAMSPYADWQQIAWAGAFVVVGFILILSAAARFLLARNAHKF